jgi:hypothetical protein
VKKSRISARRRAPGLAFPTASIRSSARSANVLYTPIFVTALTHQDSSGTQLGQWALDVSPFTHIPKIPGGALAPTPLISLVASLPR